MRILADNPAVVFAEAEISHGELGIEIESGAQKRRSVIRLALGDKVGSLGIELESVEGMGGDLGQRAAVAADASQGFAKAGAHTRSKSIHLSEKVGLLREAALLGKKDFVAGGVEGAKGDLEGATETDDAAGEEEGDVFAAADLAGQSFVNAGGIAALHALQGLIHTGTRVDIEVTRLLQGDGESLTQGLVRKRLMAGIVEVGDEHRTARLEHRRMQPAVKRGRAQCDSERGQGEEGDGETVPGAAVERERGEADAGGVGVGLKGLQGGEQLGGRGKALARVLGQEAGNNGLKNGGHAGIEKRQGRGVMMEDALTGSDEGTGEEGISAGESFVENHAQGEEVGAAVGNFLAQELRGHVGGSTGEGGEAIHGRAAIGAGEVASQAEVEDLHLTGGGEHDVFRLDIAMNDAVRMSGYEGLGALQGDFEELLQSKRAAQTLAQGFALDVFHDQEDVLALLEDVVDSGDMRIVEAGGALGLVEEAAAGGRVVAQGRSHALEGDSAPELAVAGAIHLAHSPAAQTLADTEPADREAGERRN